MKKPTVSKKLGNSKVDPKTGCKVGSLGVQVGRAYLLRTTWEGSLQAVKQVIKGSFERKGKSTAEEHVTRHARSWINTLCKKFPALYPERARAKVNGKKTQADDKRKEHKESDKIGAST